MNDTPRKKVPRWRAAPRTADRRYGSCFHELRIGEKIIARAQECAGGWFWYGMGCNTAGHPVSLEQAKADALRKYQTGGGAA